MNVIHNGTQITASFSIVDDAGDTLQTVVVQASKEPNDPLAFNKITKENFDKAFKALTDTRAKLEKDVAEKAKEVEQEVIAPE